MDLIRMGNLSKHETGLPVVVWICVKHPNIYDIPHMYFANDYSGNLLARNLVKMDISDSPELIPRNETLCIGEDSFNEIRKWVIRNKSRLLSVWNGEISMIEFGKFMK